MKNSERFSTAEERYGAFYKYCEKREAEKRCDCLCMRCQFEWLELEAEKEEPLPCPFCGGEVEVQDANNGGHWVLCKNEKCLYSSGILMVRDEAISAHNRMSKAVIEIEAKHD